jgi:hypothetical protein
VEVHAVGTISLPEGPLAISSIGFVGVIAITAGFVAQLLIPGSLLAPLFTSLPAWRWFDPVPVLGSWKKQQSRARGGQHRVENDESSLEELLK